MGIKAINCKDSLINVDCCDCNKKNSSQSWKNVTPEEYIMSFGQEENTINEQQMI